MRRAKIVCTLGPATDDRADELVQAGMDVARLNFSHGTWSDHEKRYHSIREASARHGQPVAIMADLQGPKIRLGWFPAGPHKLENGATFTITTREEPGTEQRASTTYAGLPGDCSVGDLILIDDGRVAVRVTAVTDTEVSTQVEVGGYVSNHKGLNLPGVAVNVPALSKKDMEDLRFALKLGVDFVALSFVRDARDIDDVHAIMRDEGIMCPVIAKIEKPQAVANITEIICAFDALMVARGDLGVELPLEQVPMVQKQVIDLARRAAKPVIVATQVLDSMMTSPRPTRAETSDCANAVLDGADAIMLSGETSTGDFPVVALQTMARIIEVTETEGIDRIPELGTRPTSKGGAITHAAATVGEVLKVDRLAAFTSSGDSARRMSRVRSHIPLIACTPDAKVQRQLALTWGVQPYLAELVHTTDEMIAQVDELLLRSGACEPGQQVVVVYGSPVGVPGSLNAMYVHRLGDTVAEQPTLANLGTELGDAFDVPSRAVRRRTI